MADTAEYSTIFCGFSSLMDIDKLIRQGRRYIQGKGFSSLMDIDKLIPTQTLYSSKASFSSLMDIDKLILTVK